MTEVREWGKPFRGYTSSVPEHMAPPDMLVGNGASASPTRSMNLLFDPVEGSFYTRGGSDPVGGTAGLLETGTSTAIRARSLRGINSPSLTDGYDTHAVLFTREHATVASNESALYMRSTNGAGLNYVLGSEWSQANHYAYTTPVGQHNFKVVPYMRHDGTIGRLNTAALRRAAFVGSRGMLEVGTQLAIPSYHSIPMRWNKRFNDSSSSGSENLRLFPLGHLPPPPSLAVAVGTSDAQGSWTGADQFYLSVQYEFSDGSLSPYAEPRDENDQATSGIMKITLAGTSADHYRYITISGIPIGPDGCVARRILRTPKNEGGTNESPTPRDLRLAARIGNNTETSMQLMEGNDLALVAEPTKIRNDNILCPPARYIWQADNRVFVGYTKRHPAAFVLWPNVNTSDDTTTAIANIFEAELAGGTLTLRRNNDVPSTITFTANNTVTVQQVVDAINASAGSGSNKWWAAVAPGADAQQPCSSAGGANDYLTSTTGVDVGDANYAATGRIRSYCTALPAIIYYSTSWLAKDENVKAAEVGKRRFYFTMGGPGMPTNALNSWSSGTYLDSGAPNYRTAPDSWGILMGGAPILDGCVVFFSKCIAVFRNTKSGKSGFDVDYELLELYPNLGCIAWDSITHYGGVAGCLTNAGYLITDGTREGKIIISEDVYNPDSPLNPGEWDYEVKQSAAAASGDTDASHFHAEVLSGTLIITYRRSSGAADGIPNRQIRYPVTAATTQLGLRGWLSPEGRPWGWSTPLGWQQSVMGEVAKSDKVHRYGCIESNLGSTSPGRVDEFDTTTYSDNGSGYTAEWWTARDYCGEVRRKKRAVRITPLWEVGGNAMRVNFYIDSAGTQSAIGAPGLEVTSTGQDRRTPMFLPPSAQGPAATLQARFTDSGGGGSYNKIWGIEQEYELLDSQT